MNYPTQAIFKEAAFIGKSLREIPSNGGDARRNLKALGQKPSEVFTEAARSVLEGYDIAEDDMPWMITDTAHVIQNNALSWLNGPVLLVVKRNMVVLPRDAVAARTKLLASPYATELHVRGDGRRVTSDLFKDLDAFIRRVSDRQCAFTYGIRVRNVFDAPGVLKTSLTGPVVALVRHRAPAQFYMGTGSVTLPVDDLARMLDTGPQSYGNHSRPRPTNDQWNYGWVDFVR